MTIDGYGDVQTPDGPVHYKEYEMANIPDPSARGDLAAAADGPPITRPQTAVEADRAAWDAVGSREPWLDPKWDGFSDDAYHGYRIWCWEGGEAEYHHDPMLRPQAWPESERGAEAG